MPEPNATDGHAADTIIDRARRLSRYARHALAADPALLPRDSVAQPFTMQEMQACLPAAGGIDGEGLKRMLRRLRKSVMLRLIARDLGGLATLSEVVTTVTTLADFAIVAAVSHLDAALAAEYGAPMGKDSASAQKLHVIGMGKLGGCELNVSSDVDLIFVYPEEGETGGGRVGMSNHEYFNRYARRLIALLNELTADGFVFRVDMRLRPFGNDGPLTCSFGMLENYFIAHGREWERYAWIKARVVCGDRSPELHEIIRPFVFRRHLDYSAFESLRDLHRQVRREVERRDILDNIKLGPGGIREIEFIVQLFQLVRGGREAALRVQATLAVLPLLAAHDFLPESAVRELTSAYVFLRSLEHRLQYLDDKQTQDLPPCEEDRELIAQAMGRTDFAALGAQLDHHRAHVRRCFEGIFASDDDVAHPLAALWREGDSAPQLEQLRAAGYQQPEQTLALIAALRTSSRVREMPQASHARIERLVPLVIEKAALMFNPDETLARMLALLESISRREAYLALLLQYPQTVGRAVHLASASPWAAAYLARQPILLDELLDARTLHAPPDWAALESVLRRQLADAAGDIEREMDILRHFKHSQTMRLIAQDLAGELPLEKLSDDLSALADVILEQTLRLVWRGLGGRHRDEPLFAVIAYGKLGGKELGYASDLDLIFLYRDDDPQAAENYARLAQRLNNWLNRFTPAGVLYETDLRLRPDGVSGLLVSSLEGFTEYQRNKAWVWEHQALSRARWVAGEAAIGREFEALRIEILRQPRDLAQLRQEVVSMRPQILAAHPNPSEQFDIKHDPGGIIDVEFIVQYLVLGHAHRYPEMTGNIGNLALLKLAGRLGLIAADEAAAAHDAYRRLRQLQHAVRLQGKKFARVDARSLTQENAAVSSLWEHVLASPPLRQRG